MLSGIRVLSFTHFLQGPSASQLLADLGADVVKIEASTGAFERSWSAPDAYLNDASVFFLLGNRNVRSMCVDLKHPDSLEVLHEMVRSADVVIESFRPGAMDRLGLGYAALSAINPRLVYCSLSGYGSDGPRSTQPGQDILLQSFSGLATATGNTDQGPTAVGASIVDQHGAVLGAMGILAALFARATTGKGTRVESNLLSAALDLQIEPLAYFLNGFAGARSDAAVSSPYYKAPYGIYRTVDGYVCLSLNASDVLAQLFDDPWFTAEGGDSFESRNIVSARVIESARTLTTAEILTRAENCGAWAAPVNDYAAITSDPQVIHNESILTFDHPSAGTVRVLGHPIKYDGVRPGITRTPPRLGEHTREVLVELGLPEQRIDDLVAAGAVAEDLTPAVTS